MSIIKKADGRIKWRLEIDRHRSAFENATERRVRRIIGESKVVEDYKDKDAGMNIETFKESSELVTHCQTER